MNKQKKVFVGLSGGVDSSVAALRLLAEGYDVVGVFIKVWQPDFLDCDWEAERLDAMRVAAHLDIPFLMCDATEAYKKNVADYFIDAYKQGITPNPDVMCNKEVKFGAFLEFALARGADYIATGHYAIREGTLNEYRLLRGVDLNKDQSYFLWSLTQAQLSRALLPVGISSKESIRKEAMGAKIPVAAKKDSQGVCFLGHIDIPDFLSHYIDLNDGDVLNLEGETIGTHRGAFVYTLGQRHGFTVEKQSDSNCPHFIIARDIERNTVTVSELHPVGTKSETLELSSVNWIADRPEPGAKVTVQTRYRQKPTNAEIVSTTAAVAEIIFLEQHEICAPGQSCVLYIDTLCLGGGIISS
ncbi:MAG: tRNA-specific 2-thiouridylase [Candidatus Azotimanducaceae bacterium]|jgi:tRNA-specific 2-thiouridylase